MCVRARWDNRGTSFPDSAGRGKPPARQVKGFNEQRRAPQPPAAFTLHALHPRPCSPNRKSLILNPDTLTLEP